MSLVSTDLHHFKDLAARNPCSNNNNLNLLVKRPKVPSSGLSKISEAIEIAPGLHWSTYTHGLAD